MKFSLWLSDWKEHRSQNETIGEAFVKDYFTCSDAWSELWYEKDNDRATALIVDYLQHLKLYPFVPHKIGDVF